MTLLLIEIEAGRASPAQIEEFARELHTIKGESRMFGLTPIADALHTCEELAIGWKEHAPSAAVCARVIAVVDASERVLRAEPGNEAAAAAELEGAHGALAESEFDVDTPLTAPKAVPPAAAKANGDANANAPAAAEEPATTAPAVERWIQVAARQVDQVCESAAQISADFRALAARLGAIDGGATPAVRRAFVEDFDRCRAQLDGLMSSSWALRLQSIEPALGDLMRHARELAIEHGKKLRVQIEAAGAQVERTILDELWEPLVHIVRNAVDHGIEPPDQRGDKEAEATLTLHAEPSGSSVILTIRDDGRGIDANAVRAAAVRRGLLSAEAAGRLGDRQAIELVFQHGFSTRTEVSALSGRGVGLDVVRSTIEKLGGTVAIDTHLGQGTRLTLAIPTRLSLERALVVDSGGVLCGIPSRQVLEVIPRGKDAVEAVPGGEILRHRDESLPFRSLAALMAHDPIEEPWLLIVTVGTQRWALGCQALVGEFDLLRQPLDRLLDTSAHIGASATLDDGRLVLLLSLAALVRRSIALSPVRAPRAPKKRATRILVVDDSEIIRDLVTHVLTDAGFEVQAAADGGAALALIQSSAPDAVLADVEMPVMDGFELLRRVRAGWPDLPVIMLTTRASPEDRSRSAALGANAHLVKSGFQEATLLQVVRQLVDHAT